MKISQYHKFIKVEDIREYDAPDSMEHPSNEIARLIRQTIPNDGQEHVCVVAADAHCKPLAVGIVGTGTVDMCLLSPRDIFAWALTIPCARFVGIAHNHPSGDVTPSKPDSSGTAVVAVSGQMLGLDVLWSLVVTHISDAWAEVKLKNKPSKQGDDAEPKRPQSPEDEPEESPESPEDESPEMEPEESGIEPEESEQSEASTSGRNTSPSEISVDELKASVRKAFGLK